MASGVVPSFADAWTGALAFSLQLFFDFSAYSEMAIGIGLMMGFRFPHNFDAPYKSRNIQDFWRRFGA
jgi:alginate O-acetyltransferase complex protein AlgI